MTHHPEQVADAQEFLDIWREDYKSERPHGALKNMTPDEFAKQALDAHPHGGGKSIKDTAQTTQRQGRKSALQAQNPHCRWYTDGGKDRGHNGLTLSEPENGGGHEICEMEE